MSRTARGCLIVAACLAGAVLITIGLGALWWANNKDKIIAQARETRDAGAALGETTDNEGCLEESLRRHRECDSMRCNISNNFFFSACLENSRPNEDFCRGVPKIEEMMSTVQWRLRQCSARGISDSYCNELFGEIQNYCHEEPSPKTAGS